MCFICTTDGRALQLDMTYFQKGQRQDFGNIFQIILTVCSHVKLQEFKATKEMGLLFVRPLDHMASFIWLHWAVMWG